MTKYASYGTTLNRGTGAGKTEIAQVRNISGPGITLDMVDVTEHDGEGWEEQIATLLRSGPITADILWDPAEATHKNVAGGLVHDLVNKTKSAWSIGLPTTPATEISFEGYVTGFTPSMPVEGALTASVTIKATGKVTLP